MTPTSDKMFGLRTPPKQAENKVESRKSPPKTQTLDSKSRGSIGDCIREWDSAVNNSTPVTGKTEPVKQKPRLALSQPSTSKASSPVSGFSSRTAEARACLSKAKLHLNNSRNLKTEIKAGVIESVDRLYQMVKELEGEQKSAKVVPDRDSQVPKRVEAAKAAPKSQEQKKRHIEEQERLIIENDTEDKERILKHLEKQSQLLEENNKKLDELKDKIEQQHQLISSKTYAQTTTTRPTTQRSPPKNALHTVVVTSQDEEDTGEQVLAKVREAVDAKEGWINVERTRKGKDRKIIMSCGSEEDRRKVKHRLESAGRNLLVEEVKNKDPLLMLRDVLSVNSDEDILKAFRNQNRGLFHDTNGTEDRLEIKYKRKARNPHTSHVIISTSPIIWRRAIESGAVYIDLQRIRVADQSPLVQCTRCLGYGHSKKFCTEATDRCSHCGGPHLRIDCTEWRTGSEPACLNCKAAKQEYCDHNAFSAECPIRKKRDAIARMSVAYC